LAYKRDVDQDAFLKQAPSDLFLLICALFLSVSTSVVRYITKIHNGYHNKDSNGLCNM